MNRQRLPQNFRPADDLGSDADETPPPPDRAGYTPDDFAMTELTAHSSTGTAAPRRTIGRPFRKGQSGNPSGRPKSKGLVNQIRELTADGADIAQFMHRVFSGELGGNLKDRMDAASWLADRAYGRPTAAPDPVRHLSLPDANTLIAELAESVKRHVKDRAALVAISAEMRALVSDQSTCDAGRSRAHDRPPERTGAS